MKLHRIFRSFEDASIESENVIESNAPTLDEDFMDTIKEVIIVNLLHDTKEKEK